MKKVAIYQLLMLSLMIATTLQLNFFAIPSGVEKYHLLASCILLGGFGGIVYCLRGIYLNASVKGSWDPRWEAWYFIRPVVSLICGGVSYLFLKAGLLVLEAKSVEGSSDLGFLALAFIAGLNVDRFIGKIEEIAQASWGIEKSRASKGE